MTIKAKSDMVFNYHYNFVLGTATKYFYFLRGVHDGVIFLAELSLFNGTANNFTHLYRLTKIKGILRRVDYVASLNTLLVHRFTPNTYLTRDMECGVAAIGGAAGDVLQVTAHGLIFRDEDYFKAT